MVTRARDTLVWALLAILTVGPVLVASLNSLHASCESVYVIGGMAGVIGLWSLVVTAVLVAAHSRTCSGRADLKDHP